MWGSTEESESAYIHSASRYVIYGFLELSLVPPCDIGPSSQTYTWFITGFPSHYTSGFRRSHHRYPDISTLSGKEDDVSLHRILSAAERNSWLWVGDILCSGTETVTCFSWICDSQQNASRQESCMPLSSGKDAILLRMPPSTWLGHALGMGLHRGRRKSVTAPGSLIGSTYDTCWVWANDYNAALRLNSQRLVNLAITFVVRYYIVGKDRAQHRGAGWSWCEDEPVHRLHPEAFSGQHGCQ